MNENTEKIELYTLHVCTSCRPPSVPREPKTQRPGFQLYQKLREALQSSPLQDKVDLKAAECLSICPRPCGIAISKPGAWTYLFGDQVPTKTVQDILECVAVYLDSPKGFMPRAERPRYLRRSILGRVPQFQSKRLANALSRRHAPSFTSSSLDRSCCTGANMEHPW